MRAQKRLTILGTRGVPAQHGGFETFAERLSLYLVERGWSVSVYCQESGKGAITESTWRGVRRTHVPAAGDGALSTIVFDAKATWHARHVPGVCLTLGYNTAIFNILQRLSGQVNIFNMDGIEWRRAKWSAAARAWFWMNERIGCWAGHHLIADHPAIKAHLSTRVAAGKISMIPYGADVIVDADASPLDGLGLRPQEFSLVIARPEPENSILEIVRGFSRKRRDHTLVVLGSFSANNDYHCAVRRAASDEIVFPGAIYHPAVVRALRAHCRIYVHGHRVGGTNPSLVEALGAGSAVAAHDNAFNRWVAGPEAAYFGDEESCARLLDRLLYDRPLLLSMRSASRKRHEEAFMWDEILGQYEELLSRCHPS